MRIVPGELCAGPFVTPCKAGTVHLSPAIMSTHVLPTAPPVKHKPMWSSALLNSVQSTLSESVLFSTGDSAGAYRCWSSHQHR